MMRIIASGMFITCFSTVVSASCMSDGKSVQSVTLSVEGNRVERWEVTSAEIHRVRLPKGFELGVKIEPGTEEKYRELFSRHSMRGMDELVKIDLFDMRENPPALISMTWGGANSKQGFGPRGGANGVPIMGEQAELWFHKPVCVTPEKTTSAR